MEVAYFYPTNINQGTLNSNNITSFKNLNNTTNDSLYSTADTIKVDAHLTNIVKFNDFGVSLPNLAEISKIEIEYCHKKVNYQNENPQFQCFASATTQNINLNVITMENVSNNPYAATGTINSTLTYRNVPTTNFITHSIEVDKTTDLNKLNFYIAYLNTTKATRKVVEPSLGGSPTYHDELYNPRGTVQIAYVRLKITYNLPSFTLVTSRADNHNSTSQETALAVTINNINNTEISPTLYLNIPSGMELVSSDYNVRVSGYTLYWDTGLQSGVQSKTLYLVFKILTTGTKTFTFTESTNTATAKTITFTASQGVESTDTYENILAEEFPPIVIDANSTNLTDVYNVIHPHAGETVLLKIVLDDEILSKLDSITLTGATEHMQTIATLLASNFVDNEAILPLYPLSSNIEHLQVSYDLTEDGTTTTYLGQHYILHIMPSTMTYPFLTLLQLTTEERARLGDKTVYTLHSYLKLNTEETEVRDWLKNYRIGIYNPAEYDGEEDPSVQTILDEAEEWTPVLTTVNAWEKVICEFTYHHETPLYIIICGDYMEGNPQDNTLDYINPIIVESDVYKGWESTGNYPNPINNTISVNEFASLDVKTFEAGTPIIFSDLELPDNFGTNENIAVNGIKVEFDTNYADELSITTKLKSPTGETGERSLIIDNTVGSYQTYSIGGVRDTWGFQVTDLQNLNDWELEFQFNNMFTNDTGVAQIQLTNIRITIYTSIIEDSEVQVYIDGVDTRYYGLFLKDIKIPEGLETTTKYIEIDGVDSHDSYRQNIEKKEISIQFMLPSCDVYDTAEVLRTITRLFVNKRDSLNRPIPKCLEFSHYPDLYWEYILTEAFDTNLDVANADFEVKLTIPKGTAYAKQDTVTNMVGSIQGLAKVNPKIVFIPLGDTISIYETKTNQKFNMNYPNWTRENLVEIDCGSRRVLLKTSATDSNPIDISSYVDLNVDWFILHGEYYFTADNAIIQSVTTTERW